MENSNNDFMVRKGGYQSYHLGWIEYTEIKLGENYFPLHEVQDICGELEGTSMFGDDFLDISNPLVHELYKLGVIEYRSFGVGQYEGYNFCEFYNKIRLIEDL